MHDAPPDSYKLARALDRVVRRLNASMFRVLPLIDTHRIGPFGGMVIAAIWDLQPCTIQTICTDLGRDNSQMTRLLRKLENKGLIVRHPDPEDGRAQLISLTLLGEEIVKRMHAAIADAVADLSPDLTAAQTRELISLLNTLAEARRMSPSSSGTS